MLMICIVIILIYVDDLIITGSDKDLIEEAKHTLHNNFKVKDLGELKYFLWIEVVRSKQGILLNQRKYALELISDVGLSGAKPTTTPLEANTILTTVEFHKLTGDTDDPLLEDICSYQKLVGKLIYLTITLPYICFTDQVLNQFMQQPKRSHWEAALRVVACLTTRSSVTGYVIKLGDSLISWKSKINTQLIKVQQKLSISAWKLVWQKLYG
ncbi:uncharacterized mitochondrial protein AtMg00810-like [Nicotiana sylvestris]|uniref:uncharacterized mitochondrial protein AtMg00810-like n=1 Tax=Nicotiana sylvestris TaxID=4096 RepID=UPI00388C651D